MTGPGTSPAPWSVNASGGALTIVARDRSVVAIVMGNGSASPFEVGNAALMAAGPEMQEALIAYRDVVAMFTNHLRARLEEWKGFREAQALAAAALAKAEAGR
jgi:hypothetical protein